MAVLTEPGVRVPTDRRRRAPWVVLLAAVLASVLAIGGVRWLRSDSPLVGAGGRLATTMSVGSTSYVGVLIESSSATRLDVRSVAPDIVTDSASATVTVWQCTGPRSALLSGGAIASAAQTAADCTALVPFRPGTRPIGFSASSPLLLAVTPRHAGAVELGGAYVGFRHGLRSGRQLVGSAVVLTVA